MNPRTEARTPDVERAFAIALRTAHLAAVVGLGAALLGAPLGRDAAGLAVLASGVALAVLDLAARRMRLAELAGVAVAVKLVAVAWIALADLGRGPALAAFWSLLVVSSLSAHAPKALRHWRPGARRASNAGRPG